LILSAVLVQLGTLLIGLGLLAEMLTRIYMDGENRRIYTVARTRAAWPRDWAAASPRARAVDMPVVRQ
jgi:hypothetical protein